MVAKLDTRFSASKAVWQAISVGLQAADSVEPDRYASIQVSVGSTTPAVIGMVMTHQSKPPVVIQVDQRTLPKVVQLATARPIMPFALPREYHLVINVSAKLVSFLCAVAEFDTTHTETPLLPFCRNVVSKDDGNAATVWLGNDRSIVGHYNGTSVRELLVHGNGTSISWKPNSMQKPFALI